MFKLGMLGFDGAWSGMVTINERNNKHEQRN